ncbi:hypothetical protein F4823DRAFT_69891 [Ustulina deusta]|nr:hypothetical protein F4823DRAFT_69891 [Ustulina deusta]
MKREEPPLPDVDFYPHEVVDSLFRYIELATVVGQQLRGVYGHLVGFFESVAMCLHERRDQTRFEIVGDDIVNFMEGVGHNLSPSYFPMRYDRINIRDPTGRIGGHLTAFLQGLPLLRHSETSEMTLYAFGAIYNPPSRADLLTNSLLLPDPQSITKIFRASLATKHLYSLKLSQGPMEGINANSPKTLPLSWVRSGHKPLVWPERMRQWQLERWLCMHFFKLNAPCRQPEGHQDLGHGPLNMNAFFPLILYMYRIGYPAHWLSGILNSLTHGSLKTTARAPRLPAMTTYEVLRWLPLTVIYIYPLVEELRTLFVIWRRVLPFGTIIYHEFLPSIEQIREFTIHFPKTDVLAQAFGAIFVLVLWDQQMNMVPPPSGDSFRNMLVCDTASPIFPLPGRLHVISTVKWESKTAHARFWFTDPVIQVMLQPGTGWVAYMWRTDNWTPALGPVPISKDTLICGDCWW